MKILTLDLKFKEDTEFSCLCAVVCKLVKCASKTKMCNVVIYFRNRISMLVCFLYY